jgi:hypothetical protein
MALQKTLIEEFKELKSRLDSLERANQIKNIKIPTGGKFVVNAEASDPPVENGKIYYNTATNKLRKCMNGTWSDVG